MWVEQSEMRGLLIDDKDRKEKRIRSDKAVWATGRTWALTLNEVGAMNEILSRGGT